MLPLTPAEYREQRRILMRDLYTIRVRGTCHHLLTPELLAQHRRYSQNALAGLRQAYYRPRPASYGEAA